MAGLLRRRMSRYYTLAGAHTHEILILNSRFIAQGAEIQDVAAAEAFLKSVQARYPDAGHHCYAFRVVGPPGVERFSDDGEPSGTAGRPIYTVLMHQLQNAIIVVTRYFGGTKLGTGGLVKAYTQAAQELIATTGIIEREPTTALLLCYPYTLAGSLDHWLKSLELRAEREYGAEISTEIQVPLRLLAAVTAQLNEWEIQGLSWLALSPED
ncbi:MAG: IMPACT family protein [Candidatus Sericytochromatia bacterium]